VKRMVGIAAFGTVVLMVVSAPAPGRSTQAAAPYLQLVGTIPIAGQATVARGDTAKAFGSGFCGAAACSTVVLKIEAQVVARGIEVGENGTFRASFTVAEEPGRYTVTATQRAADGSTLEDSAMLVVAIGDAEEVPEVGLRVLNAREGLFLTSIHPKRCCARKVAFFQRLASPRHWRTVKRIKLRRDAARRFRAPLPHGISKVRILVPRTKSTPRRLVSRVLTVRR
jgi:hypothetical protein